MGTVINSYINNNLIYLFYTTVSVERNDWNGIALLGTFNVINFE